MLSTDLGRPVRGGFPAGRIQAGQQAFLGLQLALGLQPGGGGRLRLLREPLPRGLLRHPHLRSDFGPRAPGVARLGDETADQLIAAGREFFTDRDRGPDPVQRRLRRPRPDRRRQRANVHDSHIDNLRLSQRIVNLRLSEASLSRDSADCSIHLSDLQ